MTDVVRCAACVAILSAVGLLPDPGAAGVLTGRVVETRSRIPIAGASVELPALKRGAFTGDSGTFTIIDLPAGPVMLLVRRAGFRAAERSVLLGDSTASHVELELEPLPVELPAVEVRSHTLRDAPDPRQRPVSLSGARLAEELGRSIAETIADEPGLAQRSFGPSPARPVLRGLGGDRLLVLEDGVTAGDLSATGDDHAVTIDPAASRAVEVLRGPAALEFGSNVLAGVVNVRRDHVPADVPERAVGTLSVQGESASHGVVGSGDVSVPLGRFVLRAAGLVRSAGDLSTPEGRLENTALHSTDASCGAARIGPRGRIGASYSDYRTRYGVPGGFLGGHSSGVEIDLERQRAEFRVDANRSAQSRVRGELDGLLTRYYHRELESEGIPAISFGLLTYVGNARLRWDRSGSLGAGVVGLQGEYRDFQSGFLNFTPPTIERAGAVYVAQSWERVPWHAHAGLRLDVRQVTPAGRDTNKAGVIRPRHFAGPSGGFQLDWQGPRGISTSATVMRAFLAPSVEHLFAEGPHLAAYSYEIGNTDLDPEKGLGLSMRAQLAAGGSRLCLSVFRNSFERYLYAANTGQLEVGPGAEGFLARYRYTGASALMTGGELEAQWRISPAWSVEGNASLVRGELRVGDQPLPAMPPLKGRVGVAFQRGGWLAHLTARGAAAQRRLGEFEEPTAAYVVLGSAVTWSLASPSYHVRLTVVGDNLMDAEYRDHLSRIKSIMPEAGRSIRASLHVSL
jgi:iron complex outermembrane receptor protein